MNWAEYFHKLLYRTEQPAVGYLVDPEDSRDRPLSALGLSSSIPQQIDLSHPSVRVRSQGATNSCVGYSVSTALRLAFLRDGRSDVPDLSPRFIYYNARRGYTSRPTDVGTYIREAMRSVIKLGACPETHCPLQPVNNRPGWNAYRYAYQGRGLRGYYRIPRESPDLVRQALAAGKPVVGGWRVDDDFLRGWGPHTVGPITGKIVGGHAMVLEGYDSNRFRIHNSWGTSWREGGKVWVTDAFVAQGYDLWAIDT